MCAFGDNPVDDGRNIDLLPCPRLSSPCEFGAYIIPHHGAIRKLFLDYGRVEPGIGITVNFKH